MPIEQPLTPPIAAALAAEVYELEREAAGAPFRPDNRQLRNAFDFSQDGGAIHGRTGALFWSRESGFAVVGRGKVDPYSDAVVIGFRGTKSRFDFLSNSNTRTVTVDNGTNAHKGFYEAFLTMKPSLTRLLNPLLQGNGTTTVHLCGHSLGGALAQVAAIWVKKFYGNRVALYTFGAPRVGLREHAIAAPSSIEAIYRCVHGDDPVPMVPVWPYCHAPYQGNVVQLNRDPGIRVSAHKMGGLDNHSYQNSVRSIGWEALATREPPFSPVYLRYEDRSQVTFCEQWKHRIWNALTTILRDAGVGGAAVLAGQNLAGGLNTFYDTVAVALERVAEASSAMADHVTGLLGHMAVFAGMGRDIAIYLTRAFIRSVFRRVLAVLERKVRDAISIV